MLASVLSSPTTFLVRLSFGDKVGLIDRLDCPSIDTAQCTTQFQVPTLSEMPLTMSSVEWHPYMLPFGQQWIATIWYHLRRDFHLCHGWVRQREEREDWFGEGEVGGGAVGKPLKERERRTERSLSDRAGSGCRQRDQKDLKAEGKRRTERDTDWLTERDTDRQRDRARRYTDRRRQTERER